MSFGTPLASTGFNNQITEYSLLIARGDLDGDGLEDIVIGSNSYDGLTARPIKILKNNGAGDFIDITGILSSPIAIDFFQPSGLIADFDGDGVNDLVIFDKGYARRTLDGGYFGGLPRAFYSGVNPGSLTYVTTLGNAIAAYRSAQFPGANPAPLNCIGPKYYFKWHNYGDCDIWDPGDKKLEGQWQANEYIHAKYQSVADIDGDGDLDIFLEAGGGYGHIHYGMFFINQGNGTFAVETNRIGLQVLRGPNGNYGSWRHFANQFADINSDGCPDLIMGKMGNIDSPMNPDHDTLFTKVLVNLKVGNSCKGIFPDSLVVEIENPAGFESGAMTQATIVTAIGVSDLDNDGDMDLVLAHTRGTDGSSLSNPPDWTGTGRYIQIIEQAPGFHFSDQTYPRITDQGDAVATQINLNSVVFPPGVNPADFANNLNAVHQIRIIDIDGDGDKDIAVEKVQHRIFSGYSPIAYKRDNGQFLPFDAGFAGAPYYFMNGNGLVFLQMHNAPERYLDFVLIGAFSGAVGNPLYSAHIFPGSP